MAWTSPPGLPCSAMVEMDPWKLKAHRLPTTPQPGVLFQVWF